MSDPWTKYYRFNNIFMSHNDYKTEMELDILRETGVGVVQL